MKLEIIPVRKSKYDCLHSLIPTVAYYWDIEYLSMFAHAWDFLYLKEKIQANRVVFGDQIYPYRRQHFFSKFLTDFSGLKISFYETNDLNNIIKIIKKQIENDKPIGLYINAYNCPWNKAYKKYYYPHYCLVVGYNNDNLICIDTYSSNNESEYLNIKYIKEKKHRLIFFDIDKNNKKNISIDVVIEDILMQVKNKSYNVFKNINFFAADFFSKFDPTIECAGSLSIEEKPLFIKLKQIENNRYNYAEFILYLENKFNIEKLKLIADEFILSAKMWSKISLAIMKYILRSDQKFLLNRIKNQLYEVSDFEYGIFKKIKKILNGGKKYTTIDNCFQSNVIFSNNSFSKDYINDRIKKIIKLFQDLRIYNSVIGLFIDRSPYLIITTIGILQSGCSFIPLDPKYPDDRIIYILNDANIKILITENKYKDRLLNMGYKNNILLLSEIESNHNIYPININYNNDYNIAYTIYTSGSTGNPKGIAISKPSLNNFFNSILSEIDLTLCESMLAATTTAFDISILELLIGLFKNIDIIIANDQEYKNPRLLAKLILNNNIDIIQMTPSLMQLMLSHNKDLIFLKKLKVIIIGGEPFPESILIQLKKYTNARIYNIYGPTEATIWCTIKDLTHSETITIGKPFGENKIYIVDEDNNKVDNGEIGEICISGPQLAERYVNNIQLTDKKFISNPFILNSRMYKTGDLGKLLPNQEIEFIGRKDYQIKIRGQRIELKEIQENILLYSMIKENIVIVIDENAINKYLYCFYRSDEEINYNNIRSFLSRKLPEYMIPLIFERIHDFPLTANGKIDRNQLKIIALKSQNSKAFPKCENQNDNSMLTIILETLNNKNIEITKESVLQETGINSISFVKIIVDLETEFGIEFDNEDFDMNKFVTLQDLIVYVENKIFEKKSE